MSTTNSRPDTSAGERPQPDPRRWRALAVLGLIQFILVLDLTVVNIAIPRIQAELGFSHAGLVWVVDGYAVVAGGLLLLGGRLADIFGRRRLFLIGLAVFAAASAVCGAAVAPWMLVSGRFLQGLGEALAAPASLGLIVVLFQDRAERIKAIGIWGGLTGLGGVSGTVISGAITDLTSWRWIFLINVPIALFALIMVPRLASESRMVREHSRLNFTGALTATAGLVALVFGVLQAAERSWLSWQVLVPLLGGLALILAMVLIEHRSPSPVIPLRFFTNRTRVTANLLTLLNAAGFLTYLFLLTLFLQQVLGYSPLRAGLSYLPLGLGIGLGIGLATALMPRLGVKALLAIGFFGSAAGLLMTGFFAVDSSYFTEILPGMVVLGVFYGSMLPTVTNAALHETSGQDAGLASGVQTTMLHVGGAIGLAALATLAFRYAAGQESDGVLPDVAAVGGYVLAFRVGAALFILGGLLALLLLERVAAKPRDPLAELELAPEEEAEAEATGAGDPPERS